MTNRFRETAPSKRDIKRAVSNYQLHKEDLKVDFNNRCGYCHDHENWRNAFYEIDHFIPKKFLSDTEKTEYWNLVYSCRYCNNSKRHKWPSNDRTISNDGKIGFVDPCLEDYDNLFERDHEGKIIHKTDLAKWIFKNLNLGLKRHSIIWQLDKLKTIMNEIKNHYQSIDDVDPKIKLLLNYISLIEDLRFNDKS